jgi:UDP-N-acetylglucosamine--N-acetylmuramyl-(pentapeptide) pyrophosphoryl-undecaprenol N-acetylglucosamine transferase
MSGTVILTAGGTGGHLFPAEALARELLVRGRQVALVTDKRGGAFPVEGVPTYRVPAGRFGAGIANKLKGLIELGLGTLAAGRLLRRLKAGAVVGFGGYPSMPAMLAASRMGLPTMIHEQNAVLGRANKMLAPKVTKVATHFSTVQGLSANDTAKIAHTGNPVRPAIVDLRDQPYEAPQAGGPIRLLVIGGSLGAAILSRVVPPALLALDPALRGRLQISQQVRAEDMEKVAAIYAGSGLEVETQRFFTDMPARLASAHLVIARAGGSTTAELAVAGRPAILIPYAAAIADEQTANARHLVEAGGAWLMPERAFTAEALSAKLTQLLNEPQTLADAAAAARALGEPEAAKHLADLVEAIEREGGR